MIASLELVIITELARIGLVVSSVNAQLVSLDRDVKVISMNVCQILARLLARRIVSSS